MNPHLLTLALTTPLEQLLELPNAVRIAACAREDLQHFSAEQLAQMLASMDAAITDTVTLAQIKYGDELIDRYEKRDLDWFIEVTNQAEWPRLRSALATDRDYLRLLALYKLGVVIEATADTPPGVIIVPAVDALMESLESLVLADLLPESPSTEQIIEEAWKAGLTPDPVAADEVRKAQSQAVRRAADARHASNRAAKQKALELFASNTYRTKEEAYRIIGAQVCKAPGTIKNWIAGIPKDSPPKQFHCEPSRCAQRDHRARTVSMNADSCGIQYRASPNDHGCSPCTNPVLHCPKPASFGCRRFCP